MSHRLVTIRFSHYNEKARWAFDRFGVPFVEEGYMPGFHMLGVLRHAPRHGVGKKERNASPLATPVLITDDGRCIRGSSAIVRFVSDRYAPPGEGLYPTDEVAVLEDKLGESLGPHTRRVGYFYAFQDPTLVRSMAELNVGRTQARAFALFQPLLQPMMIRTLKVHPEASARSLGIVRTEIESMSKRLEGRRFLVGERFTAADLALACMLAPLLLPSREEGYGAVFPALAECPRAFVELAEEVRGSRAGKHALAMFANERRGRAAARPLAASASS